MTFKTPTLKEIEIDGYRCRIHAATYRQFVAASDAKNQMVGTADLCDQICEILDASDSSSPILASECLSIKGVNKAISIAIGVADTEEDPKQTF